MELNKRFRKRMVVGNDEQGAVTKPSICEGIISSDHTSTDDVFPSLYCSDGQLIGQAEALDSAENIKMSILRRLSFVDPCSVASKDTRTLVVCGVERDEGMVVLDVTWQL